MLFCSVPATLEYEARGRAQPLPQHLREVPLDRHRHHEGLDSRDPRGALLLRRREGGHQRRNLHPPPLRLFQIL